MVDSKTSAFSTKNTAFQEIENFKKGKTFVNAKDSSRWVNLSANTSDVRYCSKKIY